MIGTATFVTPRDTIAHLCCRGLQQMMSHCFDDTLEAITMQNCARITGESPFNTEVPLSQMLEDPIVQILMQHDGVSRKDVERLFRRRPHRERGR